MLNKLAAVSAISLLALTSCSSVPPEEKARQAAEEAYLYGYPMYQSYARVYRYSIDAAGPEYKGPINEIASDAPIYDADDATARSFGFIDLRAEPQVLMLPPMEKEREFSLQLLDLHGDVVITLDSSHTGIDGGNFVLAAPGWTGAKPEQTRDVINCHAPFVAAVVEIPLRSSEDVENVARIQKGFRLWPLSKFVGEPGARPAPDIDWIDPGDEAPRTPEMFRYMNFLMQLTPMPESDADEWSRFADIGVGPGLPWDASNIDPAIWNAMQDGIDDASSLLAD